MCSASIPSLAGSLCFCPLALIDYSNSTNVFRHYMFLEHTVAHKKNVSSFLLLFSMTQMQEILIFQLPLDNDAQIVGGIRGQKSARSR